MFSLSVLSSHLFAADGVVLKQKTYIFHSAWQSPIKEKVNIRIQEAFHRLNLNAKLLINPSSQRALLLANEDGDGDAGRVPNLKSIAPQNTANLIKVPEPILTMNLSVFTKNLDFPVDGWDSLEKYHNGARIGAKILEKNIPGKRTFLPTTVQLVQMLDSGRIDTLVEWSPIAEHTIANLNITSIKKLSPPIKTQAFHLYLNKKHQALVPQLNEVLRQMKKDGFFSNQTKEVTFYTGLHPPMQYVLEKRLQEAFKRGVGFKLKLINPGSAQRAIIMANEHGDGDANRVPNIKEIAPKVTENLLLIPEAINTLSFYVYTKGAAHLGNDFQSLANLRNGFRVGVKLLEKNVPGERVMLPEAKRLFQMLDDRRLDTVVAISFVADAVIKENNFSDIRKATQSLEKIPAYSLIHKKHQALIPKIVHALQEMKADGTFEKIEKDVFEEFNLN